MGYYIEVSGAFNIDPPANTSLLGQADDTTLGWQISPNGRLLYLPTDVQLPSPFTQLERVCQLLRSNGHAVNGCAKWRGEDDAHGTITVENNIVLVGEVAPPELPDSEVIDLTGQIRTGDEALKLEAMQLLDHFAINSSLVLEALVCALSDESLKVRMSAARYLCNLGEEASPAIEALIKALSDEEPWMRAAAAEALGEIGAKAERAIPYLIGLLNDSDYGPRGRAKEAIDKIGSGKSDG